MLHIPPNHLLNCNYCSFVGLLTEKIYMQKKTNQIIFLPQWHWNDFKHLEWTCAHVNFIFSYHYIACNISSRLNKLHHSLSLQSFCVIMSLTKFKTLSFLIFGSASRKKKTWWNGIDLVFVHTKDRLCYVSMSDLMLMNTKKIYIKPVQIIIVFVTAIVIASVGTFYLFL